MKVSINKHEVPLAQVNAFVTGFPRPVAAGIGARFELQIEGSELERLGGEFFTQLRDDAETQKENNEPQIFDGILMAHSLVDFLNRRPIESINMIRAICPLILNDTLRSKTTDNTWVLYSIETITWAMHQLTLLGVAFRWDQHKQVRPQP